MSISFDQVDDDECGGGHIKDFSNHSSLINSEFDCFGDWMIQLALAPPMWKSTAPLVRLIWMRVMNMITGASGNWSYVKSRLLGQNYH